MTGVEEPPAPTVGDPALWLTRVRELVGRVVNSKMLPVGPDWPARRLLASLRKATLYPAPPLAGLTLLLTAGLSELPSAPTEAEPSAPLTRMFCLLVRL